MLLFGFVPDFSTQINNTFNLKRKGKIMENLYRLSDLILDIFGVEEMIDFVCGLSDSEVCDVMDGKLMKVC